VALSSLAIGIPAGDPFSSFSIVVGLSLLWNLKGSHDKEWFETMELVELNSIQRG